MSYAQEIRAAAGRHGLDARLVAAVVWQESSFVTYAWNPEPRYRYLWDVAKRRPFRAPEAIMPQDHSAPVRRQAVDRFPQPVAHALVGHQPFARPLSLAPAHPDSYSALQ